MGKLSAGLVIILFVFLLTDTARSENVTIAVLGDSLVQGYGLPADQGFVPQMQRWLDGQAANATLINAGVSGDTTAGGLARVEWTLAPGVDALVVSLGGNDVLRGIDPAVARGNLQGILRAAADHQVPVLLVGIGAPKNFGEAYRLAYQTIYADLAAQFQVPLYPNFLTVMLSSTDRQTTLRKYYQPDALHPNAKGVALIVSDMGPSFAALAKSALP